MKQQYGATWLTNDGNRHELWPIYATDEDDAREQTIEFVIFRWGKSFVDFDSVKIKRT